MSATPPKYIYCPFCARPLTDKEDDHLMRKYCAHCNWLYFAHIGISAAAVILDGSRVLMVKRSNPPFKDTWMFPGGFLEYGEHPIAAVKREVKEETGLDIQVTKLLDVVQSNHTAYPGTLVFFYLAQTDTTSGFNLDASENSAIAWQDIHNPPPIGLSDHQEIMTLLQSQPTSFSQSIFEKTANTNEWSPRDHLKKTHPKPQRLSVSNQHSQD